MAGGKTETEEVALCRSFKVAAEEKDARVVDVNMAGRLPQNSDC